MTVETMRAVCDEFRSRLPGTTDGEQLHLDVWWPDRPLPQVVLTSSRHIAWGASLEPDDARTLAAELQRAADECDRARAALSAPASPVIERGAVLSPCRRYRYRLWRRWAPGPTVLFVMLNPSTADGKHDDPTIRRCIGFARRWGAGGIDVCNLYAYRATDPRELPGVAAIGGDDNDAEIVRAAHHADRIIAAWGASPGPLPSRPRRVAGLLAAYELEALALTKDGAPRHPLYIRGDVEPIPFNVPAIEEGVM